MLTGKVAFVTGASRGIGKAIALDLAAQGATVIGTATSDKGAEAISAYLAEAGATGAGKCLNVTNADAITEVLAEVTKEFGVPTILVNNAGITRDNLLMRMKDEEWDDIIQTNLSSVFRMSKACLRGMMKAKGGRIINIASVVGVMGNAGQTNYAAAKAGIIGFSKSLAREVGARNITVNTIAPGFIDTDMTKALPEEQRAALTTQIPLQSLGQPEDIAKAVTFLAGDGGSYITGQTLNVNGGMYMV
ncbi:3-oxoacyl-ACP reductase FabG [Thiomicrorhabdus lithotrophica]|mgnify:FL=1|uniref:3-oxoacyl-[acyl-carrier-protein] reductase n=1 Tax=Thiomicrorhabdus lithotrophica TaxID=2949997 RepID=A0ABY8CDW2_9GAMM|nr:3-oxoacyl-ACP reductase FabG [Thiomicrorhabdus lithotrophica]WEJ63437.1 3-oxoacyl-ACP reductase FabG [Thiomicrorhabdus lithotrophica]